MKISHYTVLLLLIFTIILLSLDHSSGMSHVTSIDGATGSDILMKVIPLVDEYLKEYTRSDSKVVEFLLPEELKYVFCV